MTGPHWEVVHQMWNAYIWVDDVEAVYRELRDRGAIIDYERHDIAFGQVLE